MNGDNDEFAELIARIRQGDQQAAEDLVRRFEPEVRRFVRYRLTSPSVRRFVDSLDICQSVLTRFFVSLSAGDFAVADSQQLKALLLTMARNRVFDAVSAEHAGRRDARRNVSGDDQQLAAIPSQAQTPSQIVATDELVSAVEEQLSTEDRYLVQQRLSGREWADLAQECASTPEAVRKRVSRALDQAAKALGLAPE